MSASMMKLVLFALLVSVVKPQETGTDEFWQTINGRSFTFITNTMTWSGAQIHCLSLGGTLATIHNALEADFVNTLARQQIAWIGLLDAANEGTWLWINSDILTYTKWCGGEPNNEGGQHCATTSDRNCWDDVQCNSHFPFICVKKS